MTMQLFILFCRVQSNDYPISSTITAKIQRLHFQLNKKKPLEKQFSGGCFYVIIKFLGNFTVPIDTRFMYPRKMHKKISQSIVSKLTDLFG